MTANEAKKYLRAIFQRNGYCRFPNPFRREHEKSAYKKGYEIRFIVQSHHELRQAQQALSKIRLSYGKYFTKGSQYVLPVYGKKQFKTFFHLVGLTAAYHRKSTPKPNLNTSHNATRTS